MIINQADPTIQLNLSNLSPNYSSILYQNQEEVYYQLQQHYIPATDHVSKMLGAQEITYNVQVVPYFKYRGFVSSPAEPFAHVKTTID